MHGIVRVITRLRVARGREQHFRREFADRRHAEHMARQMAGIRDVGGYLA